MPTEAPVVPQTAPGIPYVPSPETLTPGKTCPGQRETVTKGI